GGPCEAGGCCALRDYASGLVFRFRVSWLHPRLFPPYAGVVDTPERFAVIEGKETVVLTVRRCAHVRGWRRRDFGAGFLLCSHCAALRAVRAARAAFMAHRRKTERPRLSRITPSP